MSGYTRISLNTYFLPVLLIFHQQSAIFSASIYDFDIWSPWPWPWIFKANFQNRYISGMGLIDIEWKGHESIWWWAHYIPLDLWPHPSPWPWIFKFWNSHISMDCPIHLKRKGYESVQCLTHWITLTFDPPMTLTLDFQGIVYSTTCAIYAEIKRLLLKITDCKFNNQINYRCFPLPYLWFASWIFQQYCKCLRTLPNHILHLDLKASYP